MAITPEDQNRLEKHLETVNSLSEAVSSLRSEQERYNRQFHESLSKYRRAEKNVSAMDVAIKNAKKSEEEFLIVSSSLSDAQRRQAREYFKAIKNNQGALKVLKKEQKNQLKTLTDQRKETARLLGLEKQRADIADAKKTVKAGLGKIPGVRRVAGAVGQYRSTKEGVGNFGKALTTISKGKGAIGAFGGAISKFVPHITAAIIAFKAFQAVIKTINKLDKFAKSLNQEFLKMSGPVVGLGAVAEQARAFNRALFDLNRNLQRGISYTDIQKLFGAMAASGLSTQGVVQRMGSYEKAISNAKDLSVSFGVSFESMGGMMADQMLNLRSSLDGVNDAFTKMAYDAAKAGISSEKFYQSIMAGASSLSLFGDRLKFISGLKTKYLEIGMGEKDAGEAANEAAGAFKDYMTNLKAIQIIGVKESRNLAKDIIAEQDKLLAENQKAIDAQTKITEDMTKTYGERTAAEKEINRLQGDRRTLSRQRSNMSAGSAEEMARTFMFANDRMIDKLKTAFFRGAGIQLGSGRNELYTRKILEQFGMSGQFEAAQQTALSIKAGIKDAFSTGNLGGLGKVNKETLEAIKTLEKSISEGADPAYVIPQIMSQLTAAGVGGKSAQALESLAKVFPHATSKILENNTMNADQIIGLLKDQITEYAISSGIMSDVPKATQDQIKEAESLTKTMAKQFQITKEQAMYLASDNDIMKGIANGVFGIFNLLTKKWKMGPKDRSRDIRYEKASPAYQVAKQAMIDQAAIRKGIESQKAALGPSLTQGALGTLEEVAGKIGSGPVTKDSVQGILADLGKSLPNDILESDAMIELIKSMRALEATEREISNYRKGQDEVYVDALNKDVQATLKNSQELVNNSNLTADQVKLQEKEAAEKAARRQTALGSLDETEYGKKLKGVIEKIVSSSGKAFWAETLMKKKGDAGLEEFIRRNVGGPRGQRADIASGAVSDPEIRRLFVETIENELQETRKKARTDVQNLKNRESAKAFGSSAFSGGLIGVGYAGMKAYNARKNDALLTSAGWVKGSRGDLLVDKDSLSDAIGSSTGGMADKLLRESDFKPGTMKGSGNMAMSWGDVNINVNGDSGNVRAMIPEIKKAFQDSVEQSIRKYKLKESSY